MAALEGHLERRAGRERSVEEDPPGGRLGRRGRDPEPADGRVGGRLGYARAAPVARVEDTRRVIWLLAHHGHMVATLHQPVREGLHAVLGGSGLGAVVLRDEADVHAGSAADASGRTSASRISKVARVTAAMSATGHGCSPFWHAAIKASSSAPWPLSRVPRETCLSPWRCRVSSRKS